MNERAPRRPGRPRKSEGEREQVRAVIRAGTAQVLAEHRYADVTVTRIIQRTGMTRAAFYRYYRNAEEPLRLVVDEACEALLDDLARATAAKTRPDQGDHAAARVVAGLWAYLDWSGRYRHMLASMVTDGHDDSSPVHPVRQEVVAAVTAMLVEGFATTDRDTPSEGALAVFVNSVEHICHRLRTETDSGPEAVAEARDLMTRIAVALLGSPRSMQRMAEARR